MPAKARFAPPRPEPESEEESEETISDEEGEEIDPIEIINSMTVHQRRKIYALKGLQKEFRELRKQFLEEISKAELDFHTSTAALREERRKVVAGERDVTADEMKAYQEVKQESGVEEIPSDEDETEQKKQKKSVTVVSKGDEKNKSELVLASEKPDGGIPGFWFTVLRNNEVTESMVTERDAPCLQALQDVTKEYIDSNPRKGFKLHFHFAENEFFSNKVLTKTYNFDQDPETQDDDEPMLDTIDGAEIDWKSQEKKLTVILKQKKQRHKTGKGVRVVTKEEKCPSFFNFFDAPQIPEDDEEEDEDEEMSYDEKMEMDYEAATMFADSIIPRAVHYYSGRSIEEIASAMDFAGLMGGAEDDDEEGEEEEEEEEAPKGKKGGKGPKGNAGGKQPECKQQ